MTYVTAIVLAAGKGLRFESRITKPLIKINSKPVIIYCLETLNRHPEIKDIVLVVNSKNSKDINSKIKEYRLKKIKTAVLGGEARWDSVANGLKAIGPRTELVLIHDGVRPFIDRRIVSALIRETKKCGAAIAGVPVKATIKYVTRHTSHVTRRYIVEKTIDRDNLWEIQTPQVFKKDLILKAYEKFGDIGATDDAMLVEKLGHKVHLVKGSYFNIKITTPEDLVFAEAIAKRLA